MPGERDQVDVPDVPVVAQDAHSRGPGLGGELLLQPRGEGVDSLACTFGVGDEIRVPLREGLGQPEELRALALLGANPQPPQVARVADEVPPCLVEEARDRLQPGPQRRHLRRGKGERQAPQLDRPRHRRPFAQRGVALGVDHHRVERGIAGPGPQHTVVEVEAVHLGPHELAVDEPRDRPAARVDRLEAGPHLRQSACLLLHGGRRVVGDSVPHPRWLERAPLLEQSDEAFVGAGGRVGGGGHGRGQESGQHARGQAAVNSHASLLMRINAPRRHPPGGAASSRRASVCACIRRPSSWLPRTRGSRPGRPPAPSPPCASSIRRWASRTESWKCTLVSTMPWAMRSAPFRPSAK